MAWFSIPWRRTTTYEKLPLSHDEEYLKTTRPRDVRSRHKFSWGVTLINLFLTILTVTIVSLPEKPQKYLGLKGQGKEHCDCPATASTDRRYKNPELNPDLKRISGYCEKHHASRDYQSVL